MRKALSIIALALACSLGRAGGGEGYPWWLQPGGGNDTNAPVKFITIYEGVTNSWAKTNSLGYLHLRTNYTASATNTVSGSSLSALWYARGYDEIVLGKGPNFISRDSGLWHLSANGNVALNKLKGYSDQKWMRDSFGNVKMLPVVSGDRETYPDANWKQNANGDITPR